MTIAMAVLRRSGSVELIDEQYAVIESIWREVYILGTISGRMDCITRAKHGGVFPGA